MPPDSPLKAIICGYEKSGTTLLNEILRRHPRLDSGFECGFLLGESPRDFTAIQPYCTFFREKWQLSRDDVAYICDTDYWDECYRRARERSPLIEDKSCWLFDKTPIYMRELDRVLARVPGIPCVVNVRDPRALMCSWANWSGHREDAEQWIRQNLDDYCQRFLDYARGYSRAVEIFPDRIYLNRFERLCLDPARELQTLFGFIGLEFEEDYLSFTSEHFVYGNTVSTEYLYPYRETLSGGLCREILARTDEYAAWHFGQ